MICVECDDYHVFSRGKYLLKRQVYRILLDRMNIKQKITILVCTVALGFGVVAATGTTALAAQSECGGVKTSILSCSQNAKNPKNVEDTGIWGLLLLVLNIMTAGVGILAVGGVVYASILYASSSDNAEQTKRAKDIIKNIAIGILAYIGMYLLINFLIPGGVFT